MIYHPPKKYQYYLEKKENEEKLQALHGLSKEKEEEIMGSVKILLDYLHGPIRCCDEDGIKYIEQFDIIQRDITCQELNTKVESMYSSYYEFDSHNLGVGLITNNNSKIGLS